MLHCLYALNISRANWPYCIKHGIFGIRRGHFPCPRSEDILLARLTQESGNPHSLYGVKGLWYCERLEQVTNESFVPFKDGIYQTLVQFKPLVLEFSSILCEQFGGKDGESVVIEDLKAIDYNVSIRQLWPQQGESYVRAITQKLGRELERQVSYHGEQKSLKQFLQELLSALQMSQQRHVPTFELK